MSARVLIVEDKVVVANNLRDRLQDLGYTVLGTADSGEQAVRLATATEPDLVLMDIRLQGEMDGIQAAGEIRRQRDVAIVYLTGYADESTLQRAKVTQPYGYLLKPLDVRELHSTIEMALHRHAMERRLRESEEKYRALVEQSLQAIVVVQDQPLRLVFCNPRCAEVSGYALDELLSMSSQEVAGLIHPEDREQVVAWLEDLVSHRAALLSDEFRIIGKDGAIRWLTCHATGIERDGEPAVQAALIDISERRRVEEALQRAHDELEKRVEQRTAELATANVLLSEEITERRQAQEALQKRNLELTLLSAAVDQTADSVVISDPEGVILYVNPAFERASGHARAEIIGRRPSLIGGGSQDNSFYHRLSETIETGQPWHGRLVNRKSDGTLYPVDATITPVRSERGEIVNCVATMRDVSSEVSLEEQVRHTQKMEALGRLAGGVAHDFNNHLTIIELSIRLMEQHLRRDDPMWEDVQRIRETAKRATDLTKRLLHFSRREPHQPKALNLSQLVGDLGWMLRRLIGSDIQLVTRLAENLWRVEADPAQMEQVIMNLVVNARDAMPKGGTLTIETENIVLDGAQASAQLGTEPGPYVQLTVTDSGLGMSDEVKAHIFEPFFSTKKPGEGTGLGLATVFGIVKQTGGHIGVRSKTGIGTCFEIYLPRTDRAERQPEESPAAAVRSARRATETILVVEDDPVVRELTVRILASRGYRVQAATDGQEALEMSERYSNHIHLLLTDLVLPKIGGWELSECLQKRRPDMQVLYMSGYGDETNAVRRVLDAGKPLLVKPFDVGELANRVRAVLDDRS